MNQPIEEKCTDLRHTGMGDRNSRPSPIHTTIGENWKENLKKSFPNGLYGCEWNPDGSFKCCYREDVESFIENLLEQEKKRMSDDIKETYSTGTDEELVSKKQVLSIINK